MAINKKQFINHMAKKGHKTKKSCREYLNLMFDTFFELLEEGEEIKILKVLRAELIPTPERPALNPKTGEKCIVPEHKRIKIKFSKVLLRRLNEKE